MRKMLVAMLLGTALTAAPVLAQERSASALPVPVAKGPVAIWVQAQELYELGLSQGDPLLVLAAARLMLSVNPVAVEAGNWPGGAGPFLEDGAEIGRKKPGPNAPLAPPPVMRGVEGVPEAMARKKPGPNAPLAPPPVMRSVEGEPEVMARKKPGPNAPLAPPPVMRDGASEASGQLDDGAAATQADPARTLPAVSGEAAVQRSKKPSPPSGASPSPVMRGADVADMFAAAREFASGDDALLALIADAEADSSRGRVGAPEQGSTGWIHLRLRAGETDRLSWSVAAGSWTELAVKNLGEGAVNVTLTDATGAVICASEDPDPYFYCRWWSEVEGSFQLNLENPGSEELALAVVKA